MLPEISSVWQFLVVAIFVLEWFIRFIMLFIVPRNRTPSSATSWLLLIMITPTIGSFLYALFGSPKLNKLRLKSQVEVDKLTARELKQFKESNPKVFGQPEIGNLVEVAKLATELGGLPPMTGNEVELITDYEEILHAQAEAIQQSVEYVHVEYFILVLDKDTEIIFEALEKACERGVKVRVLYDLLSRRYPGYRKMIRRLSKMGAQTHEMLPLSIIPGSKYNRPDLRNHRKIIVIDGKIAFSGSANIITRNYHRKDDLLYEEMMLKLQGPIVWQYNNVFRSDWYAETKQTLLKLVEEEDIPGPVGKTLMQVLPSGPSHVHANNLMLYASLFHAATKRISIVVPYFVPDESVLQAIIIAAKRGVDVTIINSEIIDKILVGHAQRSYYDELLSVGVKIYLYKKPIFLHNKQVLVDDDIAVAGSSNLDIRSFELDLELTVILYDSSIVQKLDSIEQAYIKKSIEITVKSWSKRSFRLRLIDRLTRLTSALQ